MEITFQASVRRHRTRGARRRPLCSIERCVGTPALGKMSRRTATPGERLSVIRHLSCTVPTVALFVHLQTRGQLETGHQMRVGGRIALISVVVLSSVMASVATDDIRGNAIAPQYDVASGGNGNVTLPAPPAAPLRSFPSTSNERRENEATREKTALGSWALEQWCLVSRKEGGFALLCCWQWRSDWRPPDRRKQSSTTPQR